MQAGKSRKVVFTYLCVVSHILATGLCTLLHGPMQTSTTLDMWRVSVMVTGNRRGAIQESLTKRLLIRV